MEKNIKEEEKSSPNTNRSADFRIRIHPVTMFYSSGDNIVLYSRLDIICVFEFRGVQNISNFFW